MRIATITTGEAGMRNQALGLAASLSDDHTDFIVKPPWPFNKMPAHWVPSSVLNLPELNQVDLLISCGRRSAAFSIALKRQNPKLFTVNIQDPQIPPAYFDLVVPMQHDQCSGENVFPVLTALHNLNKNKLQVAPDNFEHELSLLPDKKIAFILGGNTRNYRFTQQNLDQVINALDGFLAEGYGVMLTTARRTPEFVLAALNKLNRPGLWMYLGQGENPYLCFLQQAEAFIMTSDSVSMVSEAMFTGKGIYLIELQGKSRRLDQFKRSCLKQGYARLWTGDYESFHYPPQDSVQQVADTIMQRLNSR